MGVLADRLGGLRKGLPLGIRLLCEGSQIHGAEILIVPVGAVLPAVVMGFTVMVMRSAVAVFFRLAVLSRLVRTGRGRLTAAGGAFPSLSGNNRHMKLRRLVQFNTPMLLFLHYTRSEDKKQDAEKNSAAGRRFSHCICTWGLL